MQGSAQNENSTSNALLTELIIVILFFALTAVTALQLFVGANQKSQTNQSAQEAMLCATNWAEKLTGQTDPASLLLASGFAQDDSGLYSLREGEYMVQVSVTTEQKPAGVLMHASIVTQRSVEDAERPDQGLKIPMAIATYVADPEVAQ